MGESVRTMSRRFLVSSQEDWKIVIRISNLILPLHQSVKRLTTEWMTGIQFPVGVGISLFALASR